MPKLTDDLATLYGRLVERWTAEERAQRQAVLRERVQKLHRLERQGVLTVADLLDRLPRLPTSLKQFGIESIWLLKIRQGISVLINPMSDEKVRVSCADALHSLHPAPKTIEHFLRIGHRELNSTSPDQLWLDAMIYGIGCPRIHRAAELLVTIFERIDLPGWLRGNAADKLGCCDLVRDRRTRLFRRCRTAALQGLTDTSIDVQFWSMYVIGSLCGSGIWPRRLRLNCFKSALPRLREFAAHDQRLAPGFWWSMSAEAEDVIECIETGHWPPKDAAARSQDKSGSEWKRLL